MMMMMMMMMNDIPVFVCVMKWIWKNHVHSSFVTVLTVNVMQLNVGRER